MPIEDDSVIRGILESAKSIAVVGASPKPWRDSGSIAQFLAQKGYKVYPVNPRYAEVHGMKCYPDLESIRQPIDIVDVFRNPEEIAPVVDGTLRIRAKTLWLQLGVVNEKEAARAEHGGVRVVMDHCIAVDHRRLIR
ncbi:MAG TPA: CoA-binding protein [Bacteroidota bacterium]|nr:CoA-binding protein [Bacteroidota bacterium]